MKHAGRNFDLSNGSSSSWIFKFSKYLISTCFWWNKTPVSRFLGSVLGKNHFSHAGKALFIAKVPVSNNSKSLWHQHFYHNLTLSARTHPQHNLHLLANPFSSAISNSYSNTPKLFLSVWLSHTPWHHTGFMKRSFKVFLCCFKISILYLQNIKFLGLSHSTSYGQGGPWCLSVLALPHSNKWLRRAT